MKEKKEKCICKQLTLNESFKKIKLYLETQTTLTCKINVWRINELGSDCLFILTILVLCHQFIFAVMDVSGIDQLQAAVVLVLSGHVDHGPDVVLLLEQLVLVIPEQLRFWIPRHSEWDAPVVVPFWTQQLLDCWGN